MAPGHSRRDILKQFGMAGLGLSVANLPGWVLPALAQGETVVPFADYPPTYNPTPSPITRNYDIRTIDGPGTPEIPEGWSFMAWLNRRTWEHEWAKFGIVDASGTVITTPPARPQSRRIL